MRTVPKRFEPRIQFFQDHLAPWTLNASAIGTCADAVSTLAARVAAARDAYEARQIAQQAARAATAAFHNAVAAMSDRGAAIMSQIRAQAQFSADPQVFTLAQIAPPAAPSRVGPPGRPDNFKVALLADGALELKWTCANPAGCDGPIYQIWRRTAPMDPFLFLGTSGGKKFIDDSIPAGASAITYRIQATRSTSAGPWAQFNVNFGRADTGASTASIVKVAAGQAA